MDLLEESERGWMMLFLVSNPKFTERRNKVQNALQLVVEAIVLNKHLNKYKS